MLPPPLLLPPRVLVPVLTLVLVSSFALSIASPDEVGVTFNPTYKINENFSVIEFLQDRGVKHVRIMQPSVEAIEKFYGSGISLSVVILSNLDINILANSSATAHTWLIDHNITPDSAKSVTFNDISLGYNVTTTEENFFFSPANDTMNAMSNLRVALDAFGLGNVSVTTEHTYSIIVNASTPSSAEFHPALAVHLKQQLDLLQRWRSPFQIEVHPYALFRAGGCSLRFALFEVAHDGPHSLLDPESRLRYSNAFEMMLDSVVVALMKLGHGSMEVEVVATGWPEVSRSGNEVEATGLNAAEYYTRVVRWVMEGSGTPLRPRWSPRTYLHSLLDDATNSYMQSYKAHMGITLLNVTSCIEPLFDIRWDGDYKF